MNEASNGRIVLRPRDDSIYESSHLIPAHMLVPPGSSQRVRGSALDCSVVRVYEGLGLVVKSQPLLVDASAGGQLEPMFDAELAGEGEVEAVIVEP